jgi:hypothetical protein
MMKPARAYDQAWFERILLDAPTPRLLARRAAAQLALLRFRHITNGVALGRGVGQREEEVNADRGGPAVIALGEGNRQLLLRIWPW